MGYPRESWLVPATSSGLSYLNSVTEEVIDRDGVRRDIQLKGQACANTSSARQWGRSGFQRPERSPL
jgi:hypothetical protein